MKEKLKFNKTPHTNKAPSNSDQSPNNSQAGSNQRSNSFNDINPQNLNDSQIPNISQDISQQNLQNNSQIGYSQQNQPTKSIIKSIYQLFNMYVVEYDDGSGNTIKIHFNKEEYKRIFADCNDYTYPDSIDENGQIKWEKVFYHEFESSNQEFKKSATDNFLKCFKDEKITPQAAFQYFDYSNVVKNESCKDQHIPKNPLFYYSTKETPSTNQQNGSSDISAIEVNFNIAYGQGKTKPTLKEFNDNILSCYIKIQSETYKDQYIKFTPEMDEKGNITIKRDNKLYSYGDKDMTAGDTFDFTNLKNEDLPNLTFNIYQQFQEGQLKSIYSNNDLNQSGRDITKSSLQNNTPQNELQLPKIPNLQTNQNKK